VTSTRRLTSSASSRTSRTPSWEHVLPGEVGTGPLEDLDLHLRDPQFPAQPDQLGPLVGAHALGSAGVDVVLLHPPAQTRLGDPEITGDLRDRLLPLTGQLHRPTAELRRLGCRHPRTPLRGDHRLRSGVRETGSGSVCVQARCSGPMCLPKSWRASYAAWSAGAARHRADRASWEARRDTLGHRNCYQLPQEREAAAARLLLRLVQGYRTSAQRPGMPCTVTC
jgi:hypothetical protein